jgi:hypothetical protein
MVRAYPVRCGSTTGIARDVLLNYGRDMAQTSFTAGVLVAGVASSVEALSEQLDRRLMGGELVTIDFS